ncbi:MAG: glucoamylase family protein [Acidobacteriota bacterium]|nr:glucoamylase family protein [Acidobacteriota bacterium]
MLLRESARLLPSPWSRREWLQKTGRLLLLSPVFALMPGCGGGGGSSSSSSSGGSGTYTGTDDQLLDGLQSAAYDYFWNQANSATGFVKDRAHVGGNDTYTVSSIAATGFGLTALCIGASRGYGAMAAIQARVLLTLQSLLAIAPSEQGYFYHFIDWSTGARADTSEVSSIDTAILMCGVLTARQYFSSNASIVAAATQLYEQVNWPWMLNGGTTLSMGWTPESGFLSARWDHYCELMMLYLLGIGSPTYPLDAATWQAWARPTYTYQGTTYISAGDPLFTHQYSHAWFDFRNKQDAYANYFQNSVYATTAHRLFCISLNAEYSDYASNLWGITSSDSVNGYVAWGGPPALGAIDGSIVPCAAAGSLPFLPTDCLAVLRNLRGAYPSAWGIYGFADAFNPLKSWYDVDVLGIDLGIGMLMAENYRTGLVWQTFMANAEATAAMQRAGFSATT